MSSTRDDNDVAAADDDEVDDVDVGDVGGDFFFPSGNVRMNDA